jgi:hypothetical protein
METPMRLTRTMKIPILLACLWSGGCAAIHPRPPESAKRSNAPAGAAPDNHAELERELSLYSD